MSWAEQEETVLCHCSGLWNSVKRSIAIIVAPGSGSDTEVNRVSEYRLQSTLQHCGAYQNCYLKLVLSICDNTGLRAEFLERIIDPTERTSLRIDRL